MSFKRKISRLNFGVGKMKGRDTYRWWRHRAVISTSISIPIANARAPSGLVLFTRFVVHFSFRLYEETTSPRQFLNRCARLIAFPGASFFRTLNPKNLKIEPPVLPKWFRVSHRFDESLEPLATTNCDDISRERSRVHRKCFDKVLDALVRYYARFVVESWSERKNERKRERGFERGKKKKNSCPFFSLSLSLSSFFSSLFFSLHSLFLSFFPKKWDEEIFWFFWPLLFGRRKEPGAIEE